MKGAGIAGASGAGIAGATGAGIAGVTAIMHVPPERWPPSSCLVWKPMPHRRQRYNAIFPKVQMRQNIYIS